MKYTFQLRNRSFYLWLMLIVLLSTGCQSTGPGGARQPKEGYYRPPTPVNAPTLISGQAGAVEGSSSLAGSEDNAGPTATVECKDNLVFLKDLTIPDGTVVAPDSTLDKRWEVENNGNCNWSSEYRVRLIAGPELGAQKEQALYPARSGTQTILRILFKAPQEAGTYRSAWQAFNPQGEPFGDPFFIDIAVGVP